MHDASDHLIHWVLHTSPYDTWKDGATCHNLPHVGEHKQLREDYWAKRNGVKIIQLQYIN